MADIKAGPFIITPNDRVIHRPISEAVHGDTSQRDSLRSVLRAARQKTGVNEKLDALLDDVLPRFVSVLGNITDLSVAHTIALMSDEREFITGERADAILDMCDGGLEVIKKLKNNTTLSQEVLDDISKLAEVIDFVGARVVEIAPAEDDEEDEDEDSDAAGDGSLGSHLTRLHVLQRPSLMEEHA